MAVIQLLVLEEHHEDEGLGPVLFFVVFPISFCDFGGLVP